MSHTSSIVYLIVDADYGDRLRGLPANVPAWIADTPTNHPIIQNFWSARPAPAGGAGLTSFKVAPDKTPEDWLLGIMDALELHHGEYSQTPPYSELRVIGTSLTPRLRAEFDENGFARYEDSPDGFIAYKLAA
jgi:hypothetical protein